MPAQCLTSFVNGLRIFYRVTMDGSGDGRQIIWAAELQRMCCPNTVTTINGNTRLLPHVNYY